MYLPKLLPQILRVLNHDTSKDRNDTIKLLEALRKFGNNLDDYMHLILPPIVKLFDASGKVSGFVAYYLFCLNCRLSNSCFQTSSRNRRSSSGHPGFFRFYFENSTSFSPHFRSKSRLTSSSNGNPLQFSHPIGPQI